MTTHDILKDLCYKYIREIPKRGFCGIQRMVFTTGLFYGLTPERYIGRYCYDSYADAIKAIEEWDGEGDPPGDWIKNKGKIEYSNPKTLK